MKLLQLLGHLQSGKIKITDRGHQVKDLIPSLQAQIEELQQPTETLEMIRDKLELILKHDLPLRYPIVSSPFGFWEVQCEKCGSLVLPVLEHFNELTFVDRIQFFSSQDYQIATQLGSEYLRDCIASQQESILINYNYKCWYCDCVHYKFSPREFMQGEYKLRCIHCDRLIEGDRAKQMFIEASLLPKTDYIYLVDNAINLTKKTIGNDIEFLQMFRTTEFLFRRKPECENTRMTVKGIIGYYQWSIDNNHDLSHFLMDAIHDLHECNLNYKEEWYSPRTAPYINYIKK